MQELRQSTEVKVRIGSAVDATDGVTPETTLALGTADQAELLKHNGVATVDISARTFAAVTACDGWYDLTLTTTDTNTLGQVTVVIQDSSLMAPIFRDFMVVTANYWDSKYSTDKLEVDITQIGGATQSATDLKDFADAGYDPGTNKITGTADMRGTDSAYTGTPPTVTQIRQEMDTNSTKMAPSQTLNDYKATGFSTHNAAAIWSVATRILTANTNFNDLTAAEMKAEAVAALADIKLDHLINIAVDTNWATTVHLDSVIGHMADVGTSATFDRTADALEAIRNRGDAAWITATGFNTTTPPTVGEIRTEMEGAGTKLLAIEGYTDKIDDATNGLTAIKAEVEGLAGAAMRGTDGANTTVPDAAGTAPTAVEIQTQIESVGSKILAIEDDTNELQTNQGAWATAVGFSTHSAADVKTAIEAAGSHIALILADTNELQTDWANGGRLDLLIDAILTDTGTTLDEKLDTILGLNQENFYIDTTVFTGANMTSCRIRLYSVAGSVGTASDVIATYTMTATYAGDNLASYKMVKA